MSIFNEPIDDILVKQLNIRQNLMGKTNRNPLELSFLNSNSSWIKLQSSVNIGGKSEPAKQNILLGGTLHNFQNEKNGKVGYWRRYGVGAAGAGSALKDDFTQNSSAYNLQTTDGQLHELGLRPMAGITSLRIDSIGAYGSVRKATVNFQCWDIKQLEILEALYMRPGYTVLLEFGRNSRINSTSDKLIDIKLKNNFFGEKIPNLQQYLTGLYKDSLLQGGHYDAFFGYVVNYKWSYRNDGGYDCMTEIISTGEVAESLKTNYSYAGAVKYTILGNSSTQDAQNAPFKGLILTTGKKRPLEIAPDDIIRFNNEYSENMLAGLIYELYTTFRYEQYNKSYSNASTVQAIIDVPNRAGTSTIRLDWGRIKYHSTIDPPTTDKNRFLFSEDNYYLTLKSFCEIITEYNLPYAYNETLQTPNGTLTAISTDSRIYTKKPTTDSNGKTIPPKPDPLLCLYNRLILSTNPDVCWIRNDDWIEIVKGSKVQITPTPPPTSYNSDFTKQNYSSGPGSFQEKINGWLNDLFYNSDPTSPTFEVNPSTSKEKILEDMYNLQEEVLSNINNYRYIYDHKTFYEALQANYQVVRGGTLNGVRNWNGLKITTSKLQLPNVFRVGYSDSDALFYDLISGRFPGAARPIPSIFYPVKHKQVLSYLRSYGKLDIELEAQLNQQAVAVDQTQSAEETQDNITEDLTKLGDNLVNLKGYFTDFKAKDSVGTSNSSFGEIGDIYINLKHAYYLAKSPDILAADPSGKNTLSLGKFFDTLIQNVQTSLGNVNNFKIHIDPIDGVARIIDLNYINKDIPKNIFEFSIGNNQTIVRDLKLESQVFSNQIAMMAISAQAQPGKLAYDNTSLTSYNNNIIDRNIPGKDVYYPTVINDSTKVINYILNLGYLVSKYLGNLFGYKASDTTLEWGFGEGGDPGSPPPIESREVFLNNYDAAFSNSYSNSLRDIIAYRTQTTNYLADNANKALLPTQLSLTIDGLAGFVIGNLFRVDNTFIPKFYKNSAKQLGYTITGLNHDIVDGDWTTTIQAYPVDLSSNVNVTSGVDDFSGIMWIDDEGQVQTASGNCGERTEDAREVFKKHNVTWADKINSDNRYLVAPKFYNDIDFIIKTIKDIPSCKGLPIFVTSLKRSYNPKSTHYSGNGIDIQVNGINGSKYNSKFTKPPTIYKNWEEFHDAKGKRINEPGGHPYNTTDKKIIDDIESTFNRFAGRGGVTPSPSHDHWYEIEINGERYQFLNENYAPSVRDSSEDHGPHFHFGRLCARKTTGTTSSSSTSSSGQGSTPATTPAAPPTPSKPAQSQVVEDQNPVPPAPTPPSPSENQNPIPPAPTPPSPSQPPKPAVTPPVPSPTIMAAPATEIPWEKIGFPFEFTIERKFSLETDFGRRQIYTYLENNGSKETYITPNFKFLNFNNTDTDAIINKLLKNMYDNGIKPKITNIDLNVEPYSNNQTFELYQLNTVLTVTIDKSNDGLAWTGFVSKITASDKAISDFNARRPNLQNPRLGKDMSTLIQNIRDNEGYTPQKFVEIDEGRYLSNLNYKPQIMYRQIFYIYTDKNP
jgi:hypothetical protein